MLQKTEGIVLGYIRYGDSSIITRIYTEEYGLQSYIVNGVRSAKAKNKISLYQPLTLLDLVVYYKENKDLKRISEIKNLLPFSSIPFDQKKVCMALFLTEVFSKCLHTDHPDKDLFQTLKYAILKLDQTSSGFENFHILTLLELCTYLGFGTVDSDDLCKGFPHSFEKEELAIISKMVDERISFSGTLTNSLRRKILECVVHFYATHIENFGSLNSLEIIKEVMLA